MNGINRIGISAGGGDCPGLNAAIQEVTERIDSLGLEPFAKALPARFERPRPIRLPSDLAPLIEHTLLKPEATRRDIMRLCDEAVEFRFRGVCVNPVFVEEAAERLSATGCSVVTVVGFPLGANITAAKVKETEEVVRLGADEVDMVTMLGALKVGDYVGVYRDIRAVVAAAGDAPVKVILETGLLEEGEKIAACLLAARAGAMFVKTSTGFGPRGAVVEDIELMKVVVGDRLGIKAAGGIRSFETARSMVEAGATRIGCSASVAIVREHLDTEESCERGATAVELVDTK